MPKDFNMDAHMKRIRAKLVPRPQVGQADMLTNFRNRKRAPAPVKPEIRQEI